MLCNSEWSVAGLANLFRGACPNFSVITYLFTAAGYAFYDYKTNDSIRRELQTDCILDKINEYRRNWLLHLQRMPQN